MKIFLDFTYLHKTQLGQKSAGHFPKISAEKMFGWPCLDAGLNI